MAETTRVGVKDQEVTEHYAVYNGDCCKVIQGLKDDSVGLSIFSPPFSDLYSYSDSLEDMGNNSYDGFFDHFGFLVKELYRVLKPGRIVAVHCMDLPTHKRNGHEIGLRDFSGDVVRLFVKHKFTYCSRHCVWKDPLVAAVRTKAIGLAHKQLVKDSSVSRTGIPDYVLAFRKPGENAEPIRHPRGLTEYPGSRPVPSNLDKYVGFDGDQKENKRSHWIWQQIASPVWMDIRQTHVLPFRGAKEEDDERHLCPLQIDVIDRCLILWSNPGDVVFTPFMGVGSEVYCAVMMGRKGVGVELKPRYYRQAKKNVEAAVRKRRDRFATSKED